jgi:hypothetical protein
MGKEEPPMNTDSNGCISGVGDVFGVSVLFDVMELPILPLVVRTLSVGIGANRWLTVLAELN